MCNTARVHEGSASLALNTSEMGSRRVHIFVVSVLQYGVDLYWFPVPELHGLSSFRPRVVNKLHHCSDIRNCYSTRIQSVALIKHAQGAHTSHITAFVSGTITFCRHCKTLRSTAPAKKNLAEISTEPGPPLEVVCSAVSFPWHTRVPFLSHTRHLLSISAVIGQGQDE